MASTNVLKCRWCEFRAPRYMGKRTGHSILYRHVTDQHEQEFLQAQGCASWREYVARMEEVENAGQ